MTITTHAREVGATVQTGFVEATMCELTEEYR